jgi:flagellar biogenesis protein FliO
MDLAKAAGAFILVIILLVVCLKFIGYLSRGRHAGRGSKAFTLRGTLVLDNRRYLAAVEVDGHLVVLGVTPERLTSLAHWSMEDETADEAPAPGPRLRAPARTAQAPPRQASAPARAARPGPAVAAPPRPQPPQAPQAAPAAPEPQATPAPRAVSESRDVPGREAPDVLLLDDPVEAPAPPRRAPQAASRASAPAPEPSLVAGPGAALAEGQQSAANGPSLGSSLVEDAFDRSLDGPNVSLSLDEDPEGALDGPQASDDFLKLFQDDFEKK